MVESGREPRWHCEEVDDATVEQCPTAVSVVGIQVNPAKPRRGVFEVRLHSNLTEVHLVSTLDTARPFTNLKALDMDLVVEDVKGAIQAMLRAPEPKYSGT